MSAPAEAARRPRRLPGARALLCVLLLLLVTALGLLLRLASVTDYLYHATVKDPERVAPGEPSIVAPADGTVLYVRHVRDGLVPEVVKRGVPVPVVEVLKTDSRRRFRDGYLIGIYMNTFGVHVNRIPNHGIVEEQLVFNGPHMDMTAAETKIILSAMVPGLVTARKLLGLAPFGTENDHDFVLQSARETLVLEDERGVRLYVVRIADYYVGKTLTWVRPGERVERGQRMGIISWGSQTDIYIEETPGMAITVEPGEYVYGGETILATY